MVSVRTSLECGLPHKEYGSVVLSDNGAGFDPTKNTDETQGTCIVFMYRHYYQGLTNYYMFKKTILTQHETRALYRPL